jgi:hypothetical protein
MTRYRPAVGWTHVIFGAVTLLPAFILPLIFGGIWSIVTVGAHDTAAPAILGVTFGVVLTIVLMVLAVSGGLSIAAGVGILRRKAWGDVLAVIASILHIANFPLGTIVGAATLWVLLFREPRSAMTAIPQRDVTF